VPPLSIYRSFDFGNLLALHMLDTRVHRARPAAGLRRTTLAPAGFDAPPSPPRCPTRAASCSAAPSRLAAAAAGASTATWQLLGQQVLMGRMNIPAPILFEALSPAAA
jgi:alkaline phosphatase D